jgi:hypothetical protein
MTRLLDGQKYDPLAKMMPGGYNSPMQGCCRILICVLFFWLAGPAWANVVITHMLKFQGHLVLVGRDDGNRIEFRSTALIFIAKKGGRVDKAKNFSVVRAIDGRPIYEIDDVEESSDGMIFWSDAEQYRVSGNHWSRQPLPEAQKQLSYWADKLALPADFSSDEYPPFMVRRDILTVMASGIRAVICGYRRGMLSTQLPGILVVENHNKRFYRLPPPSLTQLKQLRPQLHAQLLQEVPKKSRLPFDEYLRRNHRFENRVGAFARSADCIWVGAAFSDAGRTLGIGTLSGFDMHTRTWRTEAIKELADWSVSALLAEEETLWIGLCRHEADDTLPGGLARYNTSARSFDRTPLGARILGIARFFDCLHLATENGLYIMTAHGMQHIDFSQFGAAPRQKVLAGD